MPLIEALPVICCFLFDRIPTSWIMTGRRRTKPQSICVEVFVARNSWQKFLRYHDGPYHCTLATFGYLRLYGANCSWPPEIFSSLLSFVHCIRTSLQHVWHFWLGKGGVFGGCFFLGIKRPKKRDPSPSHSRRLSSWSWRHRWCHTYIYIYLYIYIQYIGLLILTSGWLPQTSSNGPWRYQREIGISIVPIVAMDDEFINCPRSWRFWVLIKDVDSWQHRKGVHNSLPLALGYGVDWSSGVGWCYWLRQLVMTGFWWMLHAWSRHQFPMRVW